MKTLQEIKDEYGYEAGFSDWRVLVSYGEDMDTHVDEVAKRFSLEVAKEALRNAAEVVNWNFNGGHDCKQAILSETNIPKL